MTSNMSVTLGTENTIGTMPTAPQIQFEDGVTRLRAALDGSF